MEKQEPLFPRTWSFVNYLLLYLLIFLIFIVSFFTVSDYLYTKSNFEHESFLLQIQTEQNIDEALRYTYVARNILDDRLNVRMEEGLQSVLLEYEQSGHDPSLMNLERIQRNLGDDMDIYVINESGVIIATTFGPELGQDFKIVPYFFEYLSKIRMSAGFFPDRIVAEKLGDGEYRKFSYMPTPDHKYILELGLREKSFGDISKKLNDQKNIEKIVSVNPYIMEFRIFNSMGRGIDNNTLPGTPALGYIEEVLKKRTTVEISDPRQGIITRYLMVDLKDDRYGSDQSRVVALVYNTRMIQDLMNRRLLFHLLVGSTAIIIGCLIAYMFSRRLTTQISKIASDVDIIAQGDLEHRISSPWSSEFVILEKSINSMVDSLKAAFQKVKDDEKFQQDIIAHLPVSVFMKNVDNGRYVFWNQTSEKMFKRKAIEVIGKTDRELFSEDMVAIIEKEDREALLNFHEKNNNQISNKLQGGRIIHLITVPISDLNSNPKYLLGIAEDLTDATLTIKKDLLFSITRRDILDQLSTIMEYLERAQLKFTQDAIETFFEKTIRSVESIRNQITFVRSLQDLGISSPKWFKVKKAFSEAVELLPKNSLDISAEMDDFEIYADPLLPRAFYNLLENSLKHGGPHLTRIRLLALASGDALTIIYEDNGVGIPADEKAKICEFGYGSNKGLGLFLACEILDYTGITLSENGEPKNGARFVILVPHNRFRHAG